MNEAADIGSQIPAILLFVVWWGLLTILDIALPRPDPEKPAALASAGTAPDKTVVPTGSACQAVSKVYPAFDAEEFLRGASQAYEIILNAYAREDAAALRPLLAADVLAAFEAAIAERRERNEKLHLTFICLKEARIVEAETDANMAEITVRFVAEVISAIRPTAPGITGDDTMRIVETGDLWTFARDMAARDRSWRLVATDKAG